MLIFFIMKSLFQNETAIQCYSCLLEQRAVKSNQAQTLRNLKALGALYCYPFQWPLYGKDMWLFGQKELFCFFVSLRKFWLYKRLHHVAGEHRDYLCRKLKIFIQ